jgi:hypothetical protein
VLTEVLLRHVLRTSLIAIAVASILAWLIAGIDTAVGLAVAAGLAVADAAGMIYLVGQILRPGAGSRKAIFGLLLIVKLAVVGALLWVAVNRLALDGLGVVLGIAVGLVGTVVGANQGSTSKEGQDAIARAEAEIQETEDNSSESG